MRVLSAALVLVTGMAVVPAWVPSLVAQEGGAAYDGQDMVAGPHPRHAVVEFAHGRLTVSRQANRVVVVLVRTDSGTFALAGDSSVIARWADSAGTLPDVSLADTGKKVSFKVWQLRAQGDKGAHMRFARLPVANGSVLSLALSNGAWGIVEPFAPDVASRILDALRGVNTPTTTDDDMELGRAARLGSADAYRDGPDTGDVLSLRTADSTYHPVIKPARMLHGGPTYPFSLQQAGVEGEALIQFVIDTTGRAEMQTLRLLRTNELRLARVSRDALLSMVFVPAELDGRKAPELVQLPFTFKLRSSP